MPIRQKKAPPLQTPDEIAKEKKLTSTCSMGMKMTLASNDCWKNQVNGEQKIAHEWKKTYQPDFEAEEEAALDRIRAMEYMRQEEREANPLRPILLEGHSKEGKGRKLYLSERNKINPQDKQGAPATVNQTIGWDSSRFGTAESPLATQRHLYHNSKGRGAPVGGTFVASTTAGGAAGNTTNTNLAPQSLQNSSAIAGSMGTAASHGKARGGGYDLLADVQSISYDGKGGACQVVRD